MATLSNLDLMSEQSQYTWVVIEKSLARLVVRNGDLRLCSHPAGSRVAVETYPDHNLTAVFYSQPWQNSYLGSEVWIEALRAKAMGPDVILLPAIGWFEGAWHDGPIVLFSGADRLVLWGGGPQNHRFRMQQLPDVNVSCGGELLSMAAALRIRLRQELINRAFLNICVSVRLVDPLYLYLLRRLLPDARLALDGKGEAVWWGSYCKSLGVRTRPYKGAAKIDLQDYAGLVQDSELLDVLGALKGLVSILPKDYLRLLKSCKKA